MVRFKTIKFKHFRQAQEINKRIESNEATDEEILLFAVSLVDEWDFVDVETQEPLALDDVDNLSMAQCGEINELFARAMGVTAEIPKENGSPSSST
jgi:hypothetical protein